MERNYILDAIMNDDTLTVDPSPETDDDIGIELMPSGEMITRGSAILLRLDKIAYKVDHEFFWAAISVPDADKQQVLSDRDSIIARLKEANTAACVESAIRAIAAYGYALHDPRDNFKRWLANTLFAEFNGIRGAEEYYME